MNLAILLILSFFVIGRCEALNAKTSKARPTSSPARPLNVESLKPTKEKKGLRLTKAPTTSPESRLGPGIQECVRDDFATSCDLCCEGVKCKTYRSETVCVEDEDSEMNSDALQPTPSSIVVAAPVFTAEE
jgi:hypothetical protein